MRKQSKSVSDMEEIQMKLIITENYVEMSNRGAEIIAEEMRLDRRITLGLATGLTPVGTYAVLIEKYRAGEISFKNVHTVNLDEYVGLGGEDVHSYRYFMNEHLFNHIDIDKSNTYVPNGMADDLQAECARYTALLGKYVQDIQLLGLGSDGHIGFNEPGSDFDGHTHIAELYESTIRDNARLFDRIEDVPRRAITMGIADVMQAKKILLLANGKNKAEAVRRMIKGDISPDCPASILQRHADVCVILDKEAASYL